MRNSVQVEIIPIAKDAYSDVCPGAVILRYRNRFPRLLLTSSKTLILIIKVLFAEDQRESTMLFGETVFLSHGLQ